MSKKLVAGCLAVVLLLLLWPRASVAQILWTGGGGNNFWDNPDNWAGGVVPTASDRVVVNGPAAQDPNGPLIVDGIEAITELLIADAGSPTITMEGGTLELAGWGSWWGDAAGTTAAFNMSDGVVNFTGSPGIMELGWQGADDPVGSSVGTWVMTGGEVNAKGVDLPGKGAEGREGIGFIGLYGGVLNVGTARDGLVMHPGGEIDITEGLLVLEGDQTARVADYVDEDFIFAYGGQGTVEMEYDGDFTYVAAAQNLPCDFDGNQLCEIDDLDTLLYQALGTGSPRFDLDGSGGTIDLADRDAWLTMAGNENIGVPFVLGDTDLNGRVDATDLNNLGLNWQRVDVDSWELGDFNGDQTVNASDLNDLGLNWQHGVPAAASAVPEPIGSMLLIVGAGALLVGRRRRK